MKKLIYVNDELYIVLGTASVKVTKDTEKLKEQVYQKIAACQTKIEELKQQLRLLNEL